MISRTLKDREINYATNERELLAIVWALAKLRHYLYAVQHINIFTDHQPLTFAVSESNPNAKIKGWNARIDESGARIHYKLGKENLVADALSRQQLNVIREQEAELCAATIHSELSLTLAMIQDDLVRQFPATKFWHCKNRETDIFAATERREIMTAEHNRAHRSVQENVKQVLSEYYFPKMAKLANEIVQNCKTCARAKYDRHPKKQEIGESPIPSCAWETLHIDIFSTDRKYFLTCIDKFSKFAVVQPIPSRTIEDLKPALLQLMNYFPRAKTIYCDNEPSLNSHTISAMLTLGLISQMHHPYTVYRTDRWNAFTALWQNSPDALKSTKASATLLSLFNCPLPGTISLTIRSSTKGRLMCFRRNQTIRSMRYKIE